MSKKKQNERLAKPAPREAQDHFLEIDGVKAPEPTRYSWGETQTGSAAKRSKQPPAES